MVPSTSSPTPRSSDGPSVFRFAAAVRAITATCRSAGLTPPSFRTPPGIDGAVRTVRRRPGGTTVVSIALAGRPWAAVLADLVEGVVVANRLAGPSAEAARNQLWAALPVGVAEAA